MPRVPSRKHFADATYGLVAGVVAKAIVEILKTVDVDHQQTERMLKSLHATDFSFQLAFKSSAGSPDPSDGP